MNKHTIITLSILLVLAVLSPVGFAVAQDVAQQPTVTQRLFALFPMFIMVFLIFYLLVLLPQKKQIAAQETLLESLKKGDQVVTSSGLIGKIASVEDEVISLEIANNVRIKLEKGHIGRRFEKETA